MPTYVYKCTDCGHRFEEAHGFHDEPVQTCPDCGGRVQRVIGNVGVTFKGSGFYRTDSRSATTKGGPSAGKPAVGKDTGSAGGSGGAKDAGAAGNAGSSPTSKPDSKGSGGGSSTTP